MSDYAGYDYDLNAGDNEEYYVMGNKFDDFLLKDHFAYRYLAYYAN